MEVASMMNANAIYDWIINKNVAALCAEWQEVSLVFCQNAGVNEM